MSSISRVCFTLPPFHSSTFKRLQAATTLRHLRSIQVMRYELHVQRVFHPSTFPLFYFKRLQAASTLRHLRANKNPG